jgi:hypothetical protein
MFFGNLAKSDSDLSYWRWPLDSRATEPNSEGQGGVPAARLDCGTQVKNGLHADNALIRMAGISVQSRT